MLQHLSVKNYALIDELELSLSSGFTVITGETGAGKSIILGALGLILGQRADFSSLRNPKKKCVVEGGFVLNLDNHAAFFEKNDLDLESPCLVRREILPSGKSRAFVNDTPVKLKVLSELSERLIDVHSQHENRLLSDVKFQLELLDNFAKSDSQKEKYAAAFSSFKTIQKEIQNFEQSIGSEGVDLDYLNFLFNELEEANLQSGEQEKIEAELKTLENAEEIGEGLATVLAAFENPEITGISEQSQKVAQQLVSLSKLDSSFEKLRERWESLRLELDDILQELTDRADGAELDPERLQTLDGRLSQLVHLQKKHGAKSETELIEKRDAISNQLETIANADEKRKSLDNKLAKAETELQKAAENLHQQRLKIAPSISLKIKELLSLLNLPNANFQIRVEKLDGYFPHGAEHIQFQFSANPGSKLQALSKVASGGEMSRVMLALKAVMARQADLPAIIFDEIDTGVSGETAGKIGQILNEMGKNMQVVAITHLPQIAAAGAQHFKVLKMSSESETETRIVQLSEKERIDELARLLSGAKISAAAVENAREMLGS